ncbi:MAG: adenylyl-sulfate kinase [Rhodospirillales bacterium]|nr:adenylyl-sulfate kinase [Rhodospirillales bacterium]
MATRAKRGKSKQPATGKAGAAAPPLNIVVVGHVDHGKSTVIGRLFHDTGSLPEGKLEAITEMCRSRGMPFEWAFVMDSLKAERDQGITIDAAHIPFRSQTRPYMLIDAPGHHEFIKNMITGAASADAALLVVDVKEGVRENTRRHGYLLNMLGISQLAVAVSKMDRIGFERNRFDKVASELKSYLGGLGFDAKRVTVIPVSGRDGDNIAKPSKRMAWYKGPMVIAALDAFMASPPLTDLPLRFAVQDVYKFDTRRIIAGQLETGRLAVGDEIEFSPAGKTARVKAIEAWHTPKPKSAAAGQPAGITLDQQIFIERGQIGSHAGAAPMLTDTFRARLFWLGHRPLKTGNRYRLRLATAEYPVRVETVERVIDIDNLATSAADEVGRHAVAEVVLASRGLMALDPFTANRKTGRFVLVEDTDIVGGGLVDMRGFEDLRGRFAVKSSNIVRHEHPIELADRWRANGHKSAIIWLTGLPGAGKSTLAFGLEQVLFRKGMHAYVLDGDNIRHELSADLSFSPADRAENIRRVGQTAGVFARAGVIAISSFISPYRADRDRARAVAPGLFHEVYLSADIEACEKRDPKGLYAKARRGEIKDFTGVSAPYEEPVAPELNIDTGKLTVEESLDALVEYVQRVVALNR